MKIIKWFVYLLPIVVACVLSWTITKTFGLNDISAFVLGAVLGGIGGQVSAYLIFSELY